MTLGCPWGSLEALGNSWAYSMECLALKSGEKTGESQGPSRIPQGHLKVTNKPPSIQPTGIPTYNQTTQSNPSPSPNPSQKPPQKTLKISFSIMDKKKTRNREKESEILRKGKGKIMGGFSIFIIKNIGFCFSRKWAVFMKLEWLLMTLSIFFWCFLVFWRIGIFEGELADWPRMTWIFGLTLENVLHWLWALVYEQLIWPKLSHEMVDSLSRAEN